MGITSPPPPDPIAFNFCTGTTLGELYLHTKFQLSSCSLQPVGSVGGAPDYCAGDRGSIPRRTNTQGLKITEEKVLHL